MREAVITSALESAERVVSLGLPKNRIVLSCKIGSQERLPFISPRRTL